MVRVNYDDTFHNLMYTIADNDSLKVNEINSVLVTQGDMICLQITIPDGNTEAHLGLRFLFDAEQ